jgi:hypothetical protein
VCGGGRADPGSGVVNGKRSRHMPPPCAGRCHLASQDAVRRRKRKQALQLPDVRDRSRAAGRKLQLHVFLSKGGQVGQGERQGAQSFKYCIKADTIESPPLVAEQCGVMSGVLRSSNTQCNVILCHK